MSKQDVVVVGFKLNTPEPPAKGLQRVFGIDEETAKRLVQRLPKAVKRGADPAEAEKFAQALRSIGAKVEVRPSEPDATGTAPGGDAETSTGGGTGKRRQPTASYSTTTNRPTARASRRRAATCRCVAH